MRVCARLSALIGLSLQRLKVAAVAISQLGASVGVAIAKSDLGISHGIMKESIGASLASLMLCCVDLTVL